VERIEGEPALLEPSRSEALDGEVAALAGGECELPSLGAREVGDRAALAGVQVLEERAVAAGRQWRVRGRPAPERIALDAPASARSLVA